MALELVVNYHGVSLKQYHRVRSIVLDSGGRTSSIGVDVYASQAERDAEREVDAETGLPKVSEGVNRLEARNIALSEDEVREHFGAAPQADTLHNALFTAAYECLAAREEYAEAAKV